MALPSSGSPAGVAAQGYNSAIGSLQSSLAQNKGSDQSQLLQATQGLSQNQGKVQQGLINSGLGNTTVAQSMQQAPLQTYNNQVAGINNNLQNQQMKGFENLAGMQGQGGMGIAQLLQQLMQTQQKDQKPSVTGFGQQNSTMGV